MSEVPLHDKAGGAHSMHPGSRGGYRGTSLIRNVLLLGPYSRTIPRVLWWS